jgi:uncharacterized protein YjbI with pentapeptide repeats
MFGLSFLNEIGGLDDPILLQRFNHVDILDETMGANLQGACLDGANLQGAYLNGANLKGAWFGVSRNSKGEEFEANLLGVKGLKIEQLCEVKTIYKAKLETEILKQVQKNCPCILRNAAADKN